jgi:hypothetical protein
MEASISPMAQNQEINHETELLRLAHNLSAKPEELKPMRQVDASTVAHLNNLLQKMQFDHSLVWAKLAKVASFMPNFINAKIAQEILGPHITANLSYHLPISDVIAIAKKIRIDFLAEVTENMVAEKGAKIVDELPLDLLRPLVRKVAERGGFFAIGSFTDYVKLDLIRQLLPEIRENRHLLEISRFCNKKDRVAFAVGLLDNERIKSLLLMAAEIEYWDEILSFGRYLEERDRVRVKEILQTLDQGLVKKAQEIAKGKSYWGEVEYLFA